MDSSTELRGALRLAIETIRKMARDEMVNRRAVVEIRRRNKEQLRLN